MKKEAGTRWCSGMTESNPGGRCRAQLCRGAGLHSGCGEGWAPAASGPGGLARSASWPGGLGIGPVAGVGPGSVRRCRSRVQTEIRCRRKPGELSESWSVFSC